MPVGEQVLEVNGALKDVTTLVNTASFTDGRMIRIKTKDPSETANLHDAGAYQSIIT